MTIIEKDNVFSCDLGRVTVAYVAELRQVRVILNRTGEILRKDPQQEHMTLTGFKELCEKYDEIINHK